MNRRNTLISGAILVIAMAVGVLVVSMTMDTEPAATSRSAQGVDARPSSIPRPGSGTAPERPGDRGGSEQLAVFVLTLAAMAGIGVVVFRGGKRARAGRERWAEAGRSGHDGAIVAFDQLAPTSRTHPVGAAPVATPNGHARTVS